MLTTDEKLDRIIFLLERLIAAIVEDEPEDEVVRSLDGDVASGPRDQNASLG